MRVRDFSKTGDVVAVPHLAEVQVAAYRRFLQPDCLLSEREAMGLEGILQELFPVESRDGGLRLEYLGYHLRSPLREVAECRDLGLTYAAPLYARLRVVGAESVEEDVYLADMPVMVGTGGFVINGSDRVVVAQVQRSPGVDFSESAAADQRMQSCRFVPERGTWVELIVGRKETLLVRLGRSGRMPATWLLRAMLPQAATDAQLLELFYGVEKFNFLGPEGLEPVVGRHLADDIVNKDTGEVYAAAGDAVSEELALLLYEAGLVEVAVLKAAEDKLLLRTVQADPCKGHDDALLRIYGRFRPGEPASVERAAGFFAERFANEQNYSLGVVGRFRINRKFDHHVPEGLLTLCADDVLSAVRYMMALRRQDGVADDIDDLGNRVLRTMDKLLGESVREAMVRWRRTLREQLTAAEGTVPSPRSVAATRTVAREIEQFFARGELSQVLDQTNPLAELNHARRISALGPGGLNRKRAGFEVRDVHASHYGRICPIETPEGPNIGLIASLGIFAEVDDYGFITTPYRRRDAVNGEARQFRADEEGAYRFAPAGTRGADAAEVVTRRAGEFDVARWSEVDFMDVSPKQMVGVSASLIPFLEHNDANRALMGSNMQRQAVPLMVTEQSLVSTGMEGAIARNSGMVVTARKAGTVTEVDGVHVRVDDVCYALRKFQRLNEDTCLNQRPIVRVGQSVSAGQVLADGAATKDGELSLGRNVLVAFMIWGGYNFEDAIIISEDLVQADKYTSLHVEEFTTELRDTQLGKEEFTRDIPNVSERALANLDDQGIIRIGTRVRPGDILVGKVAPKSKVELTPEEKLLREIFGAAGVDVTNESLAVPPGSGGVVVDVRHFRRRGRHEGQMSADERKEGRRLRVDYAARLAEAVQYMLRDLARLPMLPGEETPVLAERATPAEWIGLEQDYRFEVHAFAPDVRDEARRRYLAHSSTVKALKVERDQLLRRLRSGDELPTGVFEMVKVYVAVKRVLSAGDKMAGRHGNKGVIARIVPREDMPFLPDGTPVEIVLNPLGVPSRMNVGQILETHLGWAGHALGFRAVSPVFDGANEDEIRACLREAGLPEDGKCVLYDGRTGEPFDQQVTVGRLYMMKLNHLVEEKVHARSTGPYSLITQQPLGGKARKGGQRLGEMEVWALEAYGAAHVLQEMLTVKSDDVEGRALIYESIVKGQCLLQAGTPQSLRVLVSELRGLGLHLQLDEASRVGRKRLNVAPPRRFGMPSETVAERR